MLGLHIKKGIGTLVAVLFTSLTFMAHAQTLSLPQNGTDPVVLHSLERAPEAEMLRVFVFGARTPIAGRYTLGETSMSFLPAFRFEPGQNYVARFLESGELREVAFSLPAPSSSATPAEVTAIYPSGDVLPENTLRFYLHFSVPMQPQGAFDYIRLVNASGAIDDAAFMRFKQELWNEDRTRLTVLIDPGRIKRDVATNVELGPALLSGQRYSLVVEGGWPSADGRSVLPSFEKTFRVTEALRTRPDANLWTLNNPCAGTRVPLIVEFDRPFDRHLLGQSLKIETDAGAMIKGHVDVTKQERQVRFAPHEPWPATGLRLIADPTLEDVAGNNFLDLLDHIAGSSDGTVSTTHRMFTPSNCTNESQSACNPCE